jgi:hypothetical protein
MHVFFQVAQRDHFYHQFPQDEWIACQIDQQH